MSISLQKGQKISLSKDHPGLKKLMVGLGWDPVKSQGGGRASLLGVLAGSNIDCDASVIVLQNGKLMADSDLVYYGRLRHKSGAILHQGDNLTGHGEGDDEQILISLDQVPQEYDKLVFVVNIFSAEKRNQHFGMIQNAFIRLVDQQTNTEICRYNLSEDYTDMRSMVFGEVYRHNGEWKFLATGQGTTDGSLSNLANRYK